MIQLIKHWAFNILEKKPDEQDTFFLSPHAENERLKKIQPLATNEGSLGLFEALPREVLLYLLTLFQPKELYPLFCVSRKMNWVANQDFIWMNYYRMYCVEEGVKEVPQVSNSITWKDFFITSSYWKWDTERKANTIILSNNNRVASRPSSRGSNPAVMATQPLTKYRSSFEVELVERGNWIGIGFCDSKFIVHDGPTLGTQNSPCVNGSFFCQDSTSLRIHGTQDKITVNKKLNIGDKIKIKIDFENNEVMFYRNSNLEGKIKSVVKLIDGQLYPCVNLSYGTSLKFVNQYDNKE